MAAIVTILREGSSDSIQMYVDPDEKVEQIIDNCKDYWRLEGDLEDYVLIRKNTRIPHKKTVISSNLQEGDVVRFCERDKCQTPKERVEKDSEVKDPVFSAEKWLKENVGLNMDNVDIIDREVKGNSTKILFKNLVRDEHYTVVVQSGDVETYIPAMMEEFDLEEV
ncbi:MAG: hypothetical protein ACOC87_02455 [Candidatus Natronoplasma sp.]